MTAPRSFAILMVFTLLVCCKNKNEKENFAKEITSEKRTTTIQAALTPPQAREILPVHGKSVLLKPKRRIQINKPQNVTDTFTNDKAFQIFTLRGTDDTTFTCEEGTLIKINRGAFTTSSGSLPTGELVLKIKEYYSIYDIVTSNLSTQSGDNILETGGMIFIEAFADNEKCTIKQGKSIEISFPFGKRKNDMLAFTGRYVNGKMNWLRMQPENILQIETQAEYPGGVAALKRYLEHNIILPDNLSDSNISATIFLDFVIDETGKPVDLIIRNKSQQSFKEAVLKTYMRMPRWKPATKNGIPVKSTFSQTISFLNDEGMVYNPSYIVDFEPSVSDSTINDSKPAEISCYVLSVSKLGWINCDRFYNNPNPKTDLYVKVENHNELDVSLIFHSFKTIMTGEKSLTGVLFKGIPKDEKITVLAVKKTDKILYISMTEGSTNEGIIGAMAFERVSMEKLKTKLEKLKELD